MSFEDLEVWKRSARLRADIYKTLANLKDFGFKDQITRSGLSIPSNIAEGAARKNKAEFIQFLHIALGSSSELETQLIISKNLNYSKTINGLLSKITNIRKMTFGLIKSIKNKS